MPQTYTKNIANLAATEADKAKALQNKQRAKQLEGRALKMVADNRKLVFGDANTAPGRRFANLDIANVVNRARDRAITAKAAKAAPPTAMKKGGAVKKAALMKKSSDAMGRAVKRKTADVKGRAMKKGK